MKKFKYIFLLAVFIQVACRPSFVKDKIVTGEIDEALSPSQTNFFDFYAIIQPDSNVTIGNIRKIVYADSLFYILDGEQMVVYVLDKEGKLVSKINRRGHAYNEYIDLNDIFVDQKKHELFLLSRGSKKITCL